MVGGTGQHNAAGAARSGYSGSVTSRGEPAVDPAKGVIESDGIPGADGRFSVGVQVCSEHHASALAGHAHVGSQEVAGGEVQ